LGKKPAKINLCDVLDDRGRGRGGAGTLTAGRRAVSASFNIRQIAVTNN